jgi:hypothetical protein
MFIFTEHLPVMDGLSNTNYEWNPSDHSGASDGHIHTDIQYSKKHLIFRGATKHTGKSVE